MLIVGWVAGLLVAYMTENWGTGWFILWDIMVFDQQCSIRVFPMAFAPWRVTFDQSHMLPWAWQEINVRSNVWQCEADYFCWNLLATGSRVRRRGRRVGVVV